MLAISSNKNYAWILYTLGLFVRKIMKRLKAILYYFTDTKHLFCSSHTDVEIYTHYSEVTPYCKMLFLSQQRLKNSFILIPSLLFYLGSSFICNEVDCYFKLLTVCDFCPVLYLQ